MSVLWLELRYTVKYSLSPQEIPQTFPLGFPQAIFHCISLLSSQYRYSPITTMVGSSPVNHHLQYDPVAIFFNNRGPTHARLKPFKQDFDNVTIASNWGLLTSSYKEVVNPGGGDKMTQRVRFICMATKKEQGDAVFKCNYSQKKLKNNNKRQKDKN